MIKVRNRFNFIEEQNINVKENFNKNDDNYKEIKEEKKKLII